MESTHHDEIFFGIYGLMGIMIAIFSNNPIFVPIIGLHVVGFFYIAFQSISHSRFKRDKLRMNHVLTKEEKMASTFYKFAMGGIVALIVFAAYMSYTGYANDVYPVDLSRGLLDRIMVSSDPESIVADLKAIKTHLPVEGNPVWIFPTDSSNFGRIQQDLDNMIVNVELMASLPRDSSVFNTGMIDLSDRALVMQENLIDLIPYMYVNFINTVLTAVWIAAILGIFALLKRKKEQLQTSDTTDGI